MALQFALQFVPILQKTSSQNTIASNLTMVGRIYDTSSHTRYEIHLIMGCRYKHRLSEGQCLVLGCETLSAFGEMDSRGQSLSSWREMR